MRHYRQLTQPQRYQIEGLLKAGYPHKHIALAVGVSPATISREVRRNGDQARYCGTAAQRSSDRRRRMATKAHKRFRVIEEVVTQGLELKWSPEQISGLMRRASTLFVSHEWIYRFIARDKKQGGVLFRHLRQSHRKRRKRYGGQSWPHPIPNRVGIECRPKSIDLRETVGHWEADTVVGSQHRGVLVTLVERKSGFTLAAPLKRATAKATANAIVKLLRPYQPLVKSITYDNGREFSQHEKVAKALKCAGYFADPYSSWQRGTNENTNGLIRQYFPKGQPLNGISRSRVDEVVTDLNHRPRKRHDYRTPDELMQEAFSVMERTAGMIALNG